MANEMPNLSGANSKSFWQRPEGWTGMILLVAAGIGFIAYSAAIMSMLETTLGAVALFSILGAIVYMALDPSIRNIVWALYKMACKKITGLVIQMDPIAIVNSYIDKLQKNREEMNNQISKLRQQMGSLKRLTDQNDHDRDTALATASQAKAMSAKTTDDAKKSSLQGQQVLNERQAARLDNSNGNLKQLYKKLEVIYRVLMKMYENTGIVLQDTQAEVKTRTTEYNAIKASSNAFRSAMSVINGDSDKKAMFDQSMEFMADNIGARVGEMEHFMDISKGFMDGIDLQNGVFQEQGLKMLEEWEKQGPGLLLPADEKQQLLTAAHDDSDTVNLDETDSDKVKVGRGSGHSSKYV